MTFTLAIQTCFAKYATFSGRASRPEFWFFMLFEFVLYSVAVLVDPSGTVFLIAWLVLLLPGLAVTARRLHDMSRSGWWVLLQFVPVVGSVALLIWCAFEGSPDANMWGEPPVAQDGDARADRATTSSVERIARSDVAQQLAELSRLKDAGHLTQDEFDRAKTKALSGL